MSDLVLSYQAVRAGLPLSKIPAVDDDGLRERGHSRIACVSYQPAMKLKARTIIGT